MTVTESDSRQVRDCQLNSCKTTLRFRVRVTATASTSTSTELLHYISTYFYCTTTAVSQGLRWWPGQTNDLSQSVQSSRVESVESLEIRTRTLELRTLLVISY